MVAGGAQSAAGTPVAASALKSRAPSMWIGHGPGRLDERLQTVHRPGRARRRHVRVLDADERHGGLVVLGGQAGLPHLVGVEHAVVVVERDELDPGVQRGRAVLVGHHVLAAPGHDRGPGHGEDPHGDLVRHDAGRHEQRRRLAHPRRERLLERPNGRVLAVVVVAHLGLGHGPAHPRRGPGDGVAAQVDHIGHAVRLTAPR